MKAAIYARVSTKDGKQDTLNQLVQLRRYAKACGWSVVEFVDHETGKHSDREAFQLLFKAVTRREFDVVLVWALDRFTREGVGATFGHIDKLAQYGVKFESLTEAHFRTTGPAGELMIAVAAWIAKQERIRISERTKAGLQTARNKGVQLGRPWKIFNRGRIQNLRAEGLSWRAMEKKLGVSQTTLRRALADLEAGRTGQKRVCHKPDANLVRK